MYHQNSSLTASKITWSWLVLALGPGSDCTTSSVQFLTTPKTRPAVSWQTCYRDCLSSCGFLAGLELDYGVILQFLLIWLQLSFWVLIILQHGIHVKDVVSGNLSHPGLQCIIWSLFARLLWNNIQYHTHIVSFQQCLNKYCSVSKSDTSRWQSIHNCTIDI